MSTIVINTMYTRWPQKELRSVVVFRCHLHPVLFFLFFCRILFVFSCRLFYISSLTIFYSLSHFNSMLLMKIFFHVLSS
jgi:hypothetical protein